MGYANTSQVGTGLRQRIYSRAFIVGDKHNEKERFVYLVLDTQSGDTAVRDGILEGLRDLGSKYAMYGNQNVAVTGTHSHSGPAAWLNYLLPQITSKGFNEQSYRAIVDGALLSIRRAHANLSPGTIRVGNATVDDANINRSLYSYLANPKDERDFYGDEVDKFMTLMKFTRSSDGKDIGVLNWFPVHGTSMLGNNTLVTGDNKGVAAYLFEQAARNGTVPNTAADFVAGFSQANVGDTSPNTLGAWCEDGSGERCSFKNSTCSGKTQTCRGRGPYFGLDDAGTKSCFDIGRRQYEAALRAFDSASTSLAGAVRYAHTFHDMGGFQFQKTYPNGSVVTAKTCPAALGYSFAAGTTDGPGAFDFTQNNPKEPNASPVWAVVRDMLHAPNDTQKACHYPKPILLDVGETHRPYDWTPNIVDIQTLRVGQLTIIVSPGEATTMSGRRWRNAVANSIDSEGAPEKSKEKAIVVLGGPANTYSHYITTEEEYAVQRYEGASTLYGPHTLDAYIDLTLAQLSKLSTSLQDPRAIFGPAPPINTGRSLSFITGVVRDGSGLHNDFGDVKTNTKQRYTLGDTASASFIAGNPRNDLRAGGSYSAVEREDGRGGWKRVRDDADWDLVFEWRRDNSLLGTSTATVSWEIGEDVPRGRYRLRYFGHSRAVLGTITAFEGASSAFEVV